MFLARKDSRPEKNDQRVRLSAGLDVQFSGAQRAKSALVRGIRDVHHSIRYGTSGSKRSMLAFLCRSETNPQDRPGHSSLRLLMRNRCRNRFPIQQPQDCWSYLSASRIVFWITCTKPPARLVRLEFLPESRRICQCRRDCSFAS